MYTENALCIHLCIHLIHVYIKVCLQCILVLFAVHRFDKVLFGRLEYTNISNRKSCGTAETLFDTV